MKKYLIKTSLFIFPLFIYAFASEIVLRKIPNDYSYKNRYLYEHAINIEILVLGNSHSFYGINPDYISGNSFNSSHVSQSLKYDYLIFEKYKNKLSSLNSIILPISYFTLFSHLENSIENWRIKNYVIYYNTKSNYNLRCNYETFGVKPIEILKNILRKPSETSKVTVSELGFGLNYSNAQKSDSISTGYSAAKRHTQKDLGLLDSNLYIINKFISDSKTMGIRLILFTPPATTSYIKNLDPNQLYVMKSNLHKIIMNHSHVEYYDFMHDERFSNDDYWDADHLNGTGAKKLSKYIDQIIQCEVPITAIRKNITKP